MDMAELEQRYREKLQPLYSAFAECLKPLLEQLTQRAGVPVAYVECRAKNVESFVRKVHEKGYEDPWNDVRDFAGLRVITYYPDDTGRVVDLLKGEFEWDPDHSVDKLEELGIDVFGYRSRHLVIRLGEPRSSLEEWKPYRGLWAEVQVRSVLQHAWASISHRIDYKETSHAPVPVRRRLFRLSALLELGDEEFVSIRDRVAKIVKEYKDDVSRDELDIPLDLNSLIEFLRAKVDLIWWEDLGVKLGMKPPPERASLRTVMVSNLLHTLRGLRISTVADVDTLLKEAEPHAEDCLRDFEKLVESKGRLFVAWGVDLLNILVSILNGTRLPQGFSWREERGAKGFRREIENAIRELCKGRDMTGGGGR